MKKTIAIILIASSLFSCKKENTSSTKEVKAEVKTVSTIPVIIFEKTACFGKCPIYKTEIFEDGRMVFTGDRFVKLLGTHTLSFPVEDIKDFQRRANDISFFELENKYDGQITDLPSTHTTLTLKEQTKTIAARYEIPEQLKDFNTALHTKIMSIIEPNAQKIMDKANQAQKRYELERTVQPIKRTERK